MTLDERNKRRARFIYEGTRLYATIWECPFIPKQWDEREDDFREQFLELVRDLCNYEKTSLQQLARYESWLKECLIMGWHVTNFGLSPKEQVKALFSPKVLVNDEVFMKMVQIAKLHM